jgi:CubicO group peptidase (beta-lactamase class C family)
MQKVIDSILGKATDDGRLPGVVASVVDGDGVAYEGAFGVRSLETGVAMTTDTVLRVASQTKSVVAVACLQAVEDGLLDLDAPAALPRRP